MLTTRCPECDTTFRITEEILQKAGGRVRCGLCAHIFDATSALHDQDAPGPEPDASEAPTEVDGPAKEAITEPGDGDDQRPHDGIDDAPSAQHRPASTAGDERRPVLVDEPWVPQPERPTRRSRAWAVAAAAVAVVLIGQLTHHFRADLAGMPGLGSIVQRVYSVFGMVVAQPFDLEQYELLDLTAVAQPADQGYGRLMINARVQNKGPKIQPYPHVFVRLYDRWQETIAGRYFGPNEYLASPVGDVMQMSAGRIDDAQLVIVDPGPVASGYELEFCIPAGETFRCESDDVFE